MSLAKNLGEIKAIRKNLKKKNKKVVFTNGCFDLIHAGHIDYLTKAKKMGDVLIVGLNSDSSVTKIKGKKRPILKEAERTFILSSLKPVDYIVVFNEVTPKRIIEELIPDVLVKGADWKLNDIAGKDIVLDSGGAVKTIKFVNNQSTSKIINMIVNRYKD
jgi:rfaE bifunctional protein nucleotidyltransferase chain/domain